MRAAARLRALERVSHRLPEPELWIGFADSDTFTGPGGEQRLRADLPAGRVIVLSWGEPEIAGAGHQLAGQG
jgi:hypothetical protein